MAQQPVVLLVESNPSVLASLAGFFAHEPYELLAAHTPHEALQGLRATTVSVVVFGSTEEMRGEEFFELVRRSWPDVIRVAFSGQPKKMLSITAEYGKTRFMYSRAWDSDSLTRIVRRVLVEHKRPD